MMKNLIGLLVVILALPLMPFKSNFLKPKSQFTHSELYLARKLIIPKKEILVFDEGGGLKSGDEKVLVFNLNGKYLTRVGKGGEGPGEYKGARDIYADREYLYILDGIGQSINVYELKTKKFLTRKKYSKAMVFTTPNTFVVAENKKTYISFARSVLGDKLIQVFNDSMKKEFEFLNCTPVYQNRKEMMQHNLKRSPESVRKHYYNLGYVGIANDRFYFIPWLSNQLVECSLKGEKLKKYELPLKSLAKTVPVIKIGKFNAISRRLNYQLLVKDNQVYVLSRNEQEESVIFMLENGYFKELFRMKEKLFSFDIHQDRLYGLERDQSVVFCYTLNGYLM